MNRQGGTSGKFNKAANIYTSIDPKSDHHNLRQVNARQPKLQSQSPYLIVPKGMGQTVKGENAQLPGINKLVSNVSKPMSNQGGRPKTHDSENKA